MMYTSSPGPGGSARGLASGYGFLPNSGAISNVRVALIPTLKLTSQPKTNPDSYIKLCFSHTYKCPKSLVSTGRVGAGRPGSQRVAVSWQANRLDRFLVAKQ